MKKINIFLISLFFVIFLSSCSSSVNPWTSISVKYFVSSGSGYTIETGKMYVLKGGVIEENRVKNLINSAKLTGYALTSFFNPKSVKSFNEKLDYKTPASMPDSKLGTVIDKLEDEIFFDDETLYAYYKPAADKAYTIIVRALDFQDEYGTIPSLSDEELIVTFQEGEVFTFDLLNKKIKESDLYKSFKKGIVGFASYVEDGLYVMPENYNAEIAIDTSKLGQKITSLPKNAVTTYCLGYKNDTEANSVKIDVYSLEYIPEVEEPDSGDDVHEEGSYDDGDDPVDGGDDSGSGEPTDPPSEGGDDETGDDSESESEVIVSKSVVNIVKRNTYLVDSAVFDSEDSFSLLSTTINNAVNSYETIELIKKDNITVEEKVYDKLTPSSAWLVKAVSGSAYNYTIPTFGTNNSFGTSCQTAEEEVVASGAVEYVNDASGNLIVEKFEKNDTSLYCIYKAVEKI